VHCFLRDILSVCQLHILLSKIVQISLEMQFCIGATLYVTVVTVTITFSRTKIQIFCPICPYTLQFGQENRIFLATRSVLWPKTCRKCDTAGAPPRTPLGELTTLPRPPSRLGRGHRSPYPTPLDAFGASTLAPLARRSSCPLTPNPGDAAGHRHC